MRTIYIFLQKNLVLQYLTTEPSFPLITKEQIVQYHTRTEISNYNIITVMSNYHTRTDISNYHTRTDMSNYHTKTEMSQLSRNIRTFSNNKRENINHISALAGGFLGVKTPLQLLCVIKSSKSLEFPLCS